LKTLKNLAAHERAIRSPNTRPGRIGKHESKAAELRGYVNRHRLDCDWAGRAAKVPLLAPVAELGGGRQGAMATAKVMIGLELKIRGLLPDDRVCVVATRVVKGSRRGGKCFGKQVAGATSANIRAIAKGWCASRKGNQQSRYYGIEMNKVAALFEGEGAPTGFAQDVLEYWIDAVCPQTR